MVCIACAMVDQVLHRSAKHTDFSYLYTHVSFILSIYIGVGINDWPKRALGFVRHKGKSRPPRPRLLLGVTDSIRFCIGAY